MVRFIKLYPNDFRGWNDGIYIPIWLDLLNAFSLSHNHFTTNLHSNMVRFINPSDARLSIPERVFTFQYG